MLLCVTTDAVTQQMFPTDKADSGVFLNGYFCYYILHPTLTFETKLINGKIWKGLEIR